MKRKGLALVLAAALLTLLLCGCASEPQTKYIGIVSAMDNEIAILLQEATVEHVDTVGGVDYHVGTLRGQPVIISKSGIGKVRAASGVTTLLERYPVSQVIFTGIAGGVSDDAQVLDEVVATRLLEHDYGILSNDGFTWRSGDPGFGNQPGEYYLCDERLVELAYNAAVEVVGADRAHKGTIASGDQFIASETYVKKLQKEYDACACEMEGAAVAVICQRFETPFVVLRAVSDKADGNAHDSYENFGDLAADHSSAIVLKMLEQIMAS